VFIGVVIDDELKFVVRIDYVYNKLIRYVGIVYKLAHKLPYFSRRNIYCAFVNSHVAYAIEIYANNNNNNNTSVCKAHNVSIRAESEAPEY